MNIKKISFYLLALLSVFVPQLSNAQSFHSNFDSAVSQSKATGKPIVAVFSASWCGPCQQMKKNVYPSAQVAPHHDAFVWAYLDADQASNRKLMSKFGVKGLPHISFVNASGQQFNSLLGAKSAGDFAHILKMVTQQHSELTGATTSTTQTRSPKTATTKTKTFGGLFKK